MRVLSTSLAALLALTAFGSAATGFALGEEPGKNAGTNGSHAGVAGAPAVPAPPAPASTPTAVPAPPPAPAPTLAPAPTFAPVPVPNRAAAGPVRVDVGNPGVTQAPGAGVHVVVPNNANAGAIVNRDGDRWRYRWHNGKWWYWTSENRWMYHNGDQWLNHEPAPVVIPDGGNPEQPYTTGYGGYYGPDYQNGYYYGRRGYYRDGYYYGQPGVSVGLGFGPGIRIGW